MAAFTSSSTRAARGEPVPVSPELFDLLDHARAFSRFSFCILRVTIWRFSGFR